MPMPAEAALRASHSLAFGNGSVTGVTGSGRSQGSSALGNLGHWIAIDVPIRAPSLITAMYLDLV